MLREIISCASVVRDFWRCNVKLNKLTTTFSYESDSATEYLCSALSVNSQKNFSQCVRKLLYLIQ